MLEGRGWNMDENLINRILRDREVKISELPDEFDIKSLPSDIVLIFDENFPELDDAYWEEGEE